MRSTIIKVVAILAISAPIFYGYSVDKGVAINMVYDALQRGCYLPLISEEVRNEYIPKNWAQEHHKSGVSLGFQEIPVSSNHKKIDPESRKRILAEYGITDESLARDKARNEALKQQYLHKIPISSEFESTWGNKRAPQECQLAITEYNNDHRTWLEFLKDNTTSDLGAEFFHLISIRLFTLLGVAFSIALFTAYFLSSRVKNAVQGFIKHGHKLSRVEQEIIEKAGTKKN